MLSAAPPPAAPTNATRACLLDGGQCDDGRATPCSTHYPRACLWTPIAPWRHTFARIKCCLSCCTRYWMSHNLLSSNEEYWASLSGRVSWGGGQIDYTDDWSKAGLLPHAGGEILLGHMSFALLAEGNIFSFRRLDKLKFVPHALSRRLLVMHSNSVAGAQEMLRWMNSSAGESRLRKATTVSLISRDDVAMPSKEMASLWSVLRQRWHAPNKAHLKWFVQNAIGSADGVVSLPIGVRDPLPMISYLRQAHGMEQKVRQRKTLLMCCCMQMGTKSRQVAHATLKSNGFACDSTDVPTVHRKVDGPPSWSYYAGLVQAKFVASPMGYGRDCYRTWEALTLGAIPVMLSSNSSPLDRFKYQDLPILWISSWGIVTPTFLEKEWSRMRSRAALNAYDMRRAFFPYWLASVRQMILEGDERRPLERG